MPNENHIDWLLDGKDAWNKKRELHDFRPYFSSVGIAEIFEKAGRLDHNGRVPLYGFNLSDAVFHGTNLSRVDFIGTNLHGAQLRGTLLRDTNFREADLTNAKINVGYLGEADFSNAILEGTDFVGTNLIGAELGWSRFWQAKLYPDHSEVDKSVSPKVKRIKSVADLIKNCFELKKHYQGLTLYFRGERNDAWTLRPSVMRPSNDSTFKLRAHEGEMLRELISRRPGDFGGMTSALEQMVVAQHHGLKTRLLDVSRNPCVALFSACDSRDAAGKSQDNCMDGRVHVFAVPKELVRPFDSDTVSVIANFAKLDRGYQNLLLGKTGEDSQTEDPESPLRYIFNEAMRHLYHYIRQEKPQFEKIIDPKDFFRAFVVEPKQSFERIRAQEGAFIVSAFHERFEREEIQCRVKNVPVYEHEMMTVPKKRKGEILKELSLLNFTREALYPSLEEVANRITLNYE